MPALRTKRIFTGGLNVDLSESVKSTGTYIAGRNLRPYPSVQDGKVSFQKIEGTRLVDSPIPFSSNAISIGFVEDPDNDRVFYFVVDPDDVDRNAILCYSAVDDQVRVVLRNIHTVEGSLDWSTQRNRMIQASIAGPMLYFTDNSNQPAKVNVERGMLSYDPSYTPVEDTDTSSLDLGAILPEDLTVIRRPPQFPPAIIKTVSSGDTEIPDQVNNFIKEFAFQFSYRYRYRDGEVSVPSIFSVMATQNNDDTDEAYDTIRVAIDGREVIPYEVDQVEFMVRYGNTGSFYIVKRFDRTGDEALFVAHNAGSPLEFNFFNDTRGVAVADEKAFKLFDAVPITAKAVEVARNRLFFGNYTIDLDPAVPVVLSAEPVEVTGNAVEGEYISVYARCVRIIGRTLTVQARWDRIYVRVETGDPATDGYYETSLSRGNFHSRTLPVNITVSPSDRVGGLEFDDDAEIEALVKSEWDQDCEAIKSEFNLTILRHYDSGGRGVGGQQPTVYGVDGSGDAGPFEGVQQLKSDSRYRAGILFFDFAGRTPGVDFDEAGTFTTPDRTYTRADYNAAVQWDIAANQDTNIPTWATHFSIVVTRNLTASFFIQHLCSEVQYVELDEEDNYSYVGVFNEDTTVGIAWDLSRMSSDKLGYVQQDGDILKAYATDDTSKVVLNVIDQAGKYLITDAEDIGNLEGNFYIWKDSVFEIYTPYRPSDENEFFYEVGARHEIFQAGTDDRTFSVTQGILPGDTFIKMRGLDGGFIGCEAMNPNDRHYQDWNRDIGRAFLTQSQIRTAVRPFNYTYSETWIPGTTINGLSSFNALDEGSVDRRVGPIQRLVVAGRGQEDGTVMLAISSVGTTSMYLGEQQLLDNEGDVILASSGQVVGTKNILHGDYGTDHPESAYEENKRVYWFDVRKGCWVRYAGNRLFPISSYGIESYAKELARRVGIGSEVKIVSGWDDKHGEFLSSVGEVAGWDDQDLLDDYYTVVVDTTNFADGDTLYEFEEGKEYRVTIEALDDVNYLIDYQEPANFLVDYPGDGEFLVDRLLVSGRICVVYNGVEFLCLESNETGPESFHRFTADVDGPLILRSLSGRAAIITIQVWGIENPHTIFDGDARTMVFKDDADQWLVPRDYAPELFGRVNLSVISWQAGQLYVHDDTTNLNKFYGDQYSAIVSILINEQFSIPKLLKTISLESNLAPDWTHCRAEKPYIRSSDLEDEWVDREGVWYAAILKDRLSPNISGTEEDRLIKGDDMRAQYFKVAFRWDGISELKLYLINVGMNVSSGHVPVIPTQQ